MAAAKVVNDEKMRCDQLRIKTDHPTDHKNMKKLKMDNKERGPKCQLE
jgi:hypothetical protein